MGVVAIEQPVAGLWTLAQEKLVLLQEFSSLSVRQKELPAGEELAEWEGILEQKETVIRRIDAIDLQAGQAEAEIQALLGTDAGSILLAEPKWQETLNIRQAIRETLTAARQIDEVLINQALAVRRDLVQAMHQIQAEKMGIQAYWQQASQAEGVFLDDKK